MESGWPNKIQVFGTDIQQHELKYHRKRVVVSKQFTFDSAHHLHCYDGKCKNLHGHTYKLQVMISGEVDDRGIAIDFSDIKKLTKAKVIDRLDHKYLNEELPPMNTSAENMVVWIYEQIAEGIEESALNPTLRLEEIRLWETPTSYASVTRELMEEQQDE